MASGVSVLVIGSEILRGSIQDTNSFEIANRLRQAGLQLDQILVVDDVREEISEAIRFLLKESFIIITVGGLGPTTDDLTREAISDFTKKRLCLNLVVKQSIQEFFAKRNRPYDDSNNSQAQFPEGSVIIQNYQGTAPGFRLDFLHEEKSCIIMALPGVPHEMRAMLEDSIIPIVTSKLASRKIYTCLLRTFGLSESAVNSRAKSANVNSAVKLAFQLKFPEVWIVVDSPSEDILFSEQQKLIASIGNEYIFSTKLEIDLASSILNDLSRSSKTLSVAESCTGGLVGELITSVPGSSANFLGGVITYSNKSKSDLIGVSADAINNYGAVSSEVAEMMASGCQARFGSDISISITGIAGPNGGTEQKPVGTFYVGLASKLGVESKHFFFPSSRDRVRRYAAYCALDSVRRYLEKSG